MWSKKLIKIKNKRLSSSCYKESNISSLSLLVSTSENVYNCKYFLLSLKCLLILLGPLSALGFRIVFLQGLEAIPLKYKPQGRQHPRL